MKRLWIAAGLLVLLLGASLVNAWYARELTGGLGEQLRQAQDCARRRIGTRRRR